MGVKNDTHRLPVGYVCVWGGGGGGGGGGSSTPGEKDQGSIPAVAARGRPLPTGWIGVYDVTG